MKTTFEKATEASRNGYISDQNSIEWIVQNLASVPLRTLSNDKYIFVADILKIFMQDSGMNGFRAHQVTFGKMLGMTELMFDYEPYWADPVHLRARLRLTMLGQLC